MKMVTMYADVSREKSGTRRIVDVVARPQGSTPCVNITLDHEEFIQMDVPETDLRGGYCRVADEALYRAMAQAFAAVLSVGPLSPAQERAVEESVPGLRFKRG